MAAATSVGSCRMGQLAPVLILAVLLATTAGTFRLAGASQITFFRGMGCQGNSVTIVEWECGKCIGVPLDGGYDFVYSDGQPVTFYNVYGCEYKALTLTKSDSYCAGLKALRSFMMSCGPARTDE